MTLPGVRLPMHLTGPSKMPRDAAERPEIPAASGTPAAQAGVRASLEFGLWAAGELGLPANRQLGYARMVALAAFDVRGGGPAAVCAKVRRDLMSGERLYPTGFFAEKLGSLLLEAEAFALADRTDLQFFVIETPGGWTIYADNLSYGYSDSLETAFAKAVGEALAAGRLGFASSVIAQTAAGQPHLIRWTYGRDPYPPPTSPEPTANPSSAPPLVSAEIPGGIL